MYINMVKTVHVTKKKKNLLVYGYIYMDLGNYDSSKYYYNKAAPFYEKTVGSVGQFTYYTQVAELHKRAGQYPLAIEYLIKARAIAEKIGVLDGLKLVMTELDSVYSKMGDYQQAYVFNSLYHKYDDSLKRLSEEKDVMQMEVADEQERQKLLDEEKAAKLQRKHNVQYMGITVGIAGVFLLLVLMGIFSVSETTIRILGFFAFIFLFEFIILMADNKIHHWTHGEPLKVLAIKIILIAMLLPLHHYVEKKAISYLTSHKMLRVDRKTFVRKLFKRKSTDATVEKL